LCQKFIGKKFSKLHEDFSIKVFEVAEIEFYHIFKIQDDSICLFENLILYSVSAISKILKIVRSNISNP